MQAKRPPPESVSVGLANLPDHVIAEVPFTASLVVRNLTDRPVDAAIVFNKAKMGGILYVGGSVSRVGVIQPYASATKEVKLVALAHGMQVLGGVAIADSIARKTIEMEKIADVMVMRGGKSAGEVQS